MALFTCLDKKSHRFVWSLNSKTQEFREYNGLIIFLETLSHHQTKLEL